MKTKTSPKPRKRTRTLLHKKLDTSLERLQSAELIRRLTTQDPEYIFKHALIQDTVQSSLLHSDRKRLHRAVAQTYEILFGESCLDEYAAILAQHYAQAEDDAKTLDYATRAGDVAASTYANAEAITFYNLALQVAPRAADAKQLSHLYIKRGRALELSDQYEAALENYKEMESTAHARSDRALELQSLMLRGTIHGTDTPVFNPSDAQQLADRALALAQELEDRSAEAKIFWNLLLLRVFMQRQLEAIEYGERSLALAREFNLTEQLPFTLLNLGAVYLGTGQPQRAQAMLDEARMIWREQHNLPMLADAVMMSANLTFLRGDFDTALAFSEEGRRISREIGNIAGQVSNGGTLVGILLERGELGRAWELQQEDMRLSEKTQSSFFLIFGRTMAAWMLGMLGAFGAGSEFARLALANMNQPIPPFFKSWAFVLLTLFYTAQDDLLTAEQMLKQAQLRDEITFVVPSTVFGAIAQGRLALAQGNYARAIQRMHDFVNAMHRLGLYVGVAEAELIQAKALRQQGEIAHALEILTQARAATEPHQARRILWEIFAELAEIEHARGNNEEAKNYRAQARILLEYIVEHAPPEYQQAFLNKPAIRAVMQS